MTLAHVRDLVANRIGSVAVGVLALVLVWTHCAAGQSNEDAFLDGLRFRRLFSLAELHCAEQLRDPNLEPRDRVGLVIELIRTYAEHATQSPPNERGDRWAMARKTAEDFLQQHRDNPRRLLVQVQDALTALAQGELARMEAEVATQPDEALARARDTIREAANLLEKTNKQLDQPAPGEGVTGDALTANERFSLQNHVQFQLARAYRNRALCYPQGSDDRIAALNMAIEKLNNALRRLGTGDPLIWKTHLDLAICFRLLGNPGQANQALATTSVPSAPRNVRLRSAAERARLELATGKAEKAMKDLDGQRQLLGATSAEMDFVQLEAFISLWKQAVARMDESQAELWQQKATATVAYLESNHGPYWGRLGELELLRAAGKTIGGGNVEILQRTADNLYRRGQLEEAIATYEKAASQATNLGQTGSAFDLLFKAALVEQKAKEHHKAGQRLRQLSLSMKSQPKSAEAHLLAGWNMAQATRAAPELLSEYAETLEEHIEQWPKDATSHTARMWLGRVREREQDWKAAVAAYQSVAPAHKDFTEAVSATGRCWLQWLQQQQAAGQPTKAAAEAAAQYFESLVVGPEKKWPERWTPAQRAAALLAAQLRLDFAEDSFATAETMLSAALHYCVDAPDAWQATAQSMLVVALAGQPGKRQEARRLLEKLGGGSKDRLLDLISSLSTLARQAAPQMRGELAVLQLAALAKLEEDDVLLDESMRIRIPQVKAEALAASGRIDEALALYRSLVRQYPNNRAIHFDMAQLLLDGDSKSASQQALDEWARIAKRCRRGTDEWYRAKYSIALAYCKLGNRTEAVKRIRYWKATSDIDQSDWKVRFDKLLAKCEG